MKTTGIVRRMDELGRVVIPKEIRKIHRIKEGDPIEIFVNEQGELTIKKHSPVKDINNIAVAYAEAMSATTGHTVLITDNDGVITAAGGSKKEYIGKAISSELYKAILSRKSIALNKSKGDTLFAVKKEGEEKVMSQVVTPVLMGGDIFGAVIMLGFDKSGTFGQNEILLCNTAAAFIGSQLS